MSFADPADCTPSKPTAAMQPLHHNLAIGLVYLDRWPELPSQLTEREMLINSICTLLSKKPRASHLIHLLVRAPRDDVQAALRAMLQAGCIHIGRASTVPGTGSQLLTHSQSDLALAQEPQTSALPASTLPEKAQAASVLGKLWSKISS